MKPLRLLVLASLLPLLACSKADIRMDGGPDAEGTGGEGGTGGIDSSAAETEDGAVGGQGTGGSGGFPLGGAGGGTAGGGAAGGGKGGGGQGGGAGKGGQAGGPGGQGAGGQGAGGQGAGGQGAGGQGVGGGGRGGQVAGGTAGGGASGGGGAGPGGSNGGNGGSSGNGGGAGGTGNGGSTACVAQPTVGAPSMPTAAGQLVVSELMHRTVSPISDNAGEWFELYNPSSTIAYELKGCVLSDNYLAPSNVPTVATIATSVVIPPCSYGVLAISANPGFTPLYVYGTGTSSTSVKFGNDHDDGVRVLCGNSVPIATFHYSQTDAMSNAYDGRSFSVDPAHFEANGGTPGTYCAGKAVYPTGGSNYGTPGGPNPSCEP